MTGESEIYRASCPNLCVGRMDTIEDGNYRCNCGCVVVHRELLANPNPNGSRRGPS